MSGSNPTACDLAVADGPLVMALAARGARAILAPTATLIDASSSRFTVSVVRDALARRGRPSAGLRQAQLDWLSDPAVAAAGRPHPMHWAVFTAIELGPVNAPASTPAR